jgi:hypothetical protein
MGISLIIGTRVGWLKATTVFGYVVFDTEVDHGPVPSEKSLKGDHETMTGSEPQVRR